jgi:hypothetical protein
MNWNLIVLLLCLCLLVCGMSAHLKAQVPCIFEEIKVERLNQNPPLKLQRQIWEKYSTENFGQEIYTRSEIIIPVVIHVVYFNDEQNIPDAQIYSQIERLNQDFTGANEDLNSVPNVFKHLLAKTGIQFCLANKDPDGNASPGILRVPTSLERIGTRIGPGGLRNVFYAELEGSEIWDSERYLNIYVCDMGEIGGYASAPFTAIREEDGVLVNFRYFGENNHPQFGMGRVCTHEVGHFFDLNHIWGTALDCEDDDGIADTPKQMGPYFGCPVHPQTSCGSVDLFMNYMDYVDDSCMVMFTAGQKLKMLSALSGPRYKLLNSTICNDPDTSIQESGFTIFPNPVGNGPLIVHSNNRDEFIQSWELYSIDGKLISKNSENKSFMVSIQTDHLLPAIYFLQINTLQNSSVHKIFKSD